jgi:hypothetical protein
LLLCCAELGAKSASRQMQCRPLHLNQVVGQKIQGPAVVCLAAGGQTESVVAGVQLRPCRFDGAQDVAVLKGAC